MKKILKKMFCCFPLIGIASCSSLDNIDRSTVQQLDLNRYSGQWYEIARMDHSFEKGLVGCTAQYSIQKDGSIKVINAGFKNSLDGKYKVSEGKAKRPDANEPGKLKVSFFLWFYSDYNVLELANDYRYVLVGSKSADYLWILSRSPQMDPNDLHYLLECAQQRGYDTDKLIWVKHQ